MLNEVGKNISHRGNHYVVGLGGPRTWQITQPILKKETTPAAAIAATDSVFQGIIDDILNS